MSRRPVSSQGAAKPDVKSYPTRPRTSAPRQKKPSEPLKAEEEQYRKANEDLYNQYPEMSKAYEAIIDPSNPMTFENLFTNMNMDMFSGNQPLDPNAMPNLGSFIPDAEMEKQLAPNIDKLIESLKSTQEVEAVPDIKAREREVMKMNEELDKKNAIMMDQCKALLTQLSSVQDLNSEIEFDNPAPTQDPPTNTESTKARQSDYERLNEELDKKNAVITKRAEALLAKQHQDRGPEKLSSKKPPQTSNIVPPRSVKKTPSKSDVSSSLSQTNLGNRTDSDESLDALTKEIMSGTDFSEAIRRIEAKVLKVNDNTDQTTPSIHQTADVPIEQEITSQQKTLEPNEIQDKSNERSNLTLTRPSTAPAPVPKVTVGARANDPIRDIEPPEEVGAEAIQRFLKAKLNVLQEEFDRASEEIAQKDAELQECKKELLTKQDQNLQLDKQVTSLRTQSEKQQKKLELVNNELDNSKLEIAGLKRDLDSQVRNQKKTDSTQSAIEVRLNRALEEVEKHKSTIHLLKSDNKDTQQSSSKKLEELQSENKILLKQREELMTGFKKQMKLIDNLKRQKMHIEAAKMLAFSEEEFMRVLDWWKVSD